MTAAVEPALTLDDVRKYVSPSLLSAFPDEHVQHAISITNDIARAERLDLSTLQGIRIACNRVVRMLELAHPRFF